MSTSMNVGNICQIAIILRDYLETLVVRLTLQFIDKSLILPIIVKTMWWYSSRKEGCIPKVFLGGAGSAWLVSSARGRVGTPLGSSPSPRTCACSIALCASETFNFCL